MQRILLNKVRSTVSLSLEGPFCDIHKSEILLPFQKYLFVNQIYEIHLMCLYYETF